MAMPIISDDEDYSAYSPTSFKDKLKLSICCFTTPIRHHILHPDYDSDPGHNTTKPTAVRSGQESHLEIKDRCRGFIIGRRSGGRNRRGYRSDDFKYDPESYSLNFEEGGANREDELPFSSFAARLPATPDRSWAEAPSQGTAISRTEIAGWS
ncbi:hypothetical protein LINGRAHAP2_LOCUS11926 [Linum grandiflorum]